MKKIVLILIALLVVSCFNKGPKKPKNLLSKTEMTDLLLEMHLANKTNNIVNEFNERNVNYLNLVSNKYKIDSLQFKANHDYYMYHIEDYEEIYENLKIKLDTLIKKQELVVKIEDSIRRENIKKRPKNFKMKKKFAAKDVK